MSDQELIDALWLLCQQLTERFEHWRDIYPDTGSVEFIERCRQHVGQTDVCVSVAERGVINSLERDVEFEALCPADEIQQRSDAVQIGWTDRERYERSGGRLWTEEDGTVPWTVPLVSTDGGIIRRGYAVAEDDLGAWDFCGRCIGYQD